MPLRKCPVCMDGSEPVRFKIGMPVWKGKKLRVCSSRCRRHVRKEVKTAIEYGVDKNTARRKAAYKYMKRGRQI